MPGQIGSEATWQEWLANLLDCTWEWVRVLKPDGNLFVELGDKFAGSGPSFPTKCLLDLPHRYSIACVDQLGLIKRANIVWHHTNGLPESVTDRVRVAHTMVFHLVKQPRYYTAIDEIREAQVDPRTGSNGRARDFHTDQLSRKWNPSANDYNPLGKLPGSVWSIPSQPLQVPAHLGVDHFAAWPMEVPRRLVLGWSPPGICVGCGQGRRPVVAKGYVPPASGGSRGGLMERRGWRDAAEWSPGLPKLDRETTITGYECACNEAGQPGKNEDDGAGLVGRPDYESPSSPLPPARPAIVLDPFGGTGTTALVASMHGRVGVSIDRSADYTRLAHWRCRDPGERAKALQVPKPPPIPDGQDALFTI